VDFINDEDLVPAARGCVLGALAQFADVVDTRVRSSIDFEYIDRFAGGNLLA
jgi:hypothetical protein